jgi:hypothetical protein
MDEDSKQDLIHKVWAVLEKADRVSSLRAALKRACLQGYALCLPTVMLVAARYGRCACIIWLHHKAGVSIDDDGAAHGMSPMLCAGANGKSALPTKSLFPDHARTVQATPTLW